MQASFKTVLVTVGTTQFDSLLQVVDTKKFQDDQGFIPEDVNFAIHVDRLPPIANIQLVSNAPTGPELGTEELYQAMLGKVVMVATYK